MQESLPLSQTVAQAQAIVVASVSKYTPNRNEDANPKPPRNKDIIIANAEDVIAWTRVKPAGVYDFQVVQALKGQVGENLKLTLPEISSYYYSARVSPEVGSKVLLLLRLNERGDWTPVDPTLPLIALANDIRIPDKNVGDPVSQVVRLMLASLTDPVMRRANTYLLRSIVDTQIPKAVLPYTDDPDIATRSNVLYCMATNQQVAAIPLIARLQTEMLERESGVEAVVALQQFKTPEAIPYLNPILFEPDEYIRVNTVLALQNLANRSSIPYLLLALRDPESQNVVGYAAYKTLHRLILELGRPKDRSLFQIQREAESRRLYAWWQDELMGKHIQPPPAGEQMPKPEIEVSTLPVGKLNLLLFEPLPAIRQKAIAGLEKRADRSSIPYLILALIDPNATVTYSAYITLHRLIPTLGAAKNRKDFEANREAASRPIYTWWEDELTGNHVGLKKDAAQAPIPKQE